QTSFYFGRRESIWNLCCKEPTGAQGIGQTYHQPPTTNSTAILSPPPTIVIGHTPQRLTRLNPLPHPFLPPNQNIHGHQHPLPQVAPPLSRPPCPQPW
ncbi:hypothetical protein PIB30_102060, partial [Stylosanthes scabra]|nr:hypothetical protein [Stylosanthes scabra]